MKNVFFRNEFIGKLVIEDSQFSILVEVLNPNFLSWKGYNAKTIYRTTLKPDGDYWWFKRSSVSIRDDLKMNIE